MKVKIKIKVKVSTYQTFEKSFLNFNIFFLSFLLQFCASYCCCNSQFVVKQKQLQRAFGLQEDAYDALQSQQHNHHQKYWKKY